MNCRAFGVICSPLLCNCNLLVSDASADSKYVTVVAGSTVSAQNKMAPMFLQEVPAEVAFVFIQDMATRCDGSNISKCNYND